MTPRQGSCVLQKRPNLVRLKRPVLKEEAIRTSDVGEHSLLRPQKGIAVPRRCDGPYALRMADKP